MIECSSCGSVVPEARYCPNCDAELGVQEVPPRDSSSTGRLSDAAAAADHESVTFRTLRSKHDQYDRPLGSYLFEGERPELVVAVGGVVLESYAGETWRIRPGFRRRGHAIVTDRRVLVVSPGKRGDQLYAVGHEEAVAVEIGSSWFDDTLSVELVDGSSVTLAVAGLNDEELATARDRIEELVRANDTDESRTAAFVREADDAVTDATDAASALRATADLFDERGDTVFDHHAAAADSASDLFARLADAFDVEPDDPERRPAGEADGEDASLPAPRIDVPSVRRNLERALREGDPKEAGKWAIGAGIAGFSVAVSLPFSTAAGLGAIALGGAATGAYASANPDSAAARIDPIEMAVGAKTRERRWKRRSAPGGAAVGSAVGVAEHVVERTGDSAYAHWWANVDPELVLRGAELGARTAESSPHVENESTAALLGGGFGLAYGYSELNADDVAGLLGRDASAVLPAGGANDPEGDGEDPFVEARAGDDADGGAGDDADADAGDVADLIEEAEDGAGVTETDDGAGVATEDDSPDDG